MNRADLQALLTDIANVHIGVLGDFCLDIYWMIDLDASEPSLETGKITHPVRTQRYSLGGAGNVVANLAAMGVGRLSAFGVVGTDPFGRELEHLLDRLGADITGVVRQTADWDSLVYTKPHIGDDEQNRIDFGNFNRLDDAVADRLLDALEAALPRLDAVIVNEQVRQGIHSDHLRARLRTIIAANPDRCFIVDSRHFSRDYPGACLKINDHEAAGLIGIDRAPEAMVLRAEVLRAAAQLYPKVGRPLFVSRGARGVVVHDDTGTHEVPGLQVLDRIDTVGAGDSMLAGIAAALAAGAPPATAASLGNFVAGVTIRKLRQTGTATPAEILAVGADPDYVYNPELAEDPRQATFHPHTEFEIVTALPPGSPPAHVIFDHDGTISTLRQGWEAIMEPMMVKAILGDCFADADESLYHQVVARSRQFIDQTTGIQTLIQMQGLVRLVREFGCVPESRVLDEHGYKAIYNEALLKMVNDRLAKLERGELNVADFTVKNAVCLLERLHAAGARLYLASGTDETDVRGEAEALGYAHLFNGGIFGAVGDVTKEAKRLVLDRILREIGSAGVLTFGDGPVEMRETRKRGGYAVGVASDEVRRYGRDAAKRSRLIRAGADLIVPDFSQLDALLALFGVA